MKTRIENNILIIEVPIATSPKPSSTGKTLILASTHGNAKPEGLLWQGKQVQIGLNAFVKADDTQFV